MQMSSFHLSVKNSRAYVDEILRFQPKILFCLPSLGALLGKFFQQHGVDYQFEQIFTSSESVEPDTLQFLEQTFQTRVVDWYGQTERVVAIGQCEAGSYHIQEDYSVVELLPGVEAGTYEPVGTHLHNFVMPLLRYSTHDYVIPNTQQCDCGSSFRRIEQILGRSGKTPIITPEGSYITITAHITCGVDNLLETQFAQERPGEVILKVVTNDRFSDQDKAQLIKNTLQYTSPLMKVEVREVDEIPRGPNGKFISIVNTSGMERQGSLV
jgi:phenylacetate-CoA ligase